ncbi:MAG: IS66 family insertion sequence element accessory protein TnpB [Anaeromyxobacteraceae bacterium]
MSDDERSKWTKLVADFETADLSQREFSKERGVPLSNLRYWLYKLRKESRPLVTTEAEQAGSVTEQPAPNGGSRLLPVRVVASAAPKARPGEAALLELALPSGAVLRFPVGADLEYLRQVVAALP